MRVGPRIDDQQSGLCTPLLNTIDQRTLMVRLKRLQFMPSSHRTLLQFMVNLCQRGLAIDLRFACAKKIEIRTMHHENTSHCLSSSLDALEALSLQTLTLQIAQPQSKLRCNLVLLTACHRRGSRTCPVRDSTLHRRV